MGPYVLAEAAGQPMKEQEARGLGPLQSASLLFHSSRLFPTLPKLAQLDQQLSGYYD